MAPPTIRYATTRDAIRLAFYTLGEGPAVVMLFPYHINHLALNWRVPIHRGAIEFLARYFTVVNLDFRGAGLSERRVSGLSLDSFAEDIDTVLAELQLHRVGLCAMGPAGLIACDFAARAPGRISSVVLVESAESEANRRLLSLRHLSPKVEALARGALFAGLDDKHTAVALAAAAREALQSDALKHWEGVLDGNDMLSIAARVTVPALYLHAAEDELVPLPAVHRLVRALPNAKLMIVPGHSGMDVWRDREAVEDIARFLADGFGIGPEVALAQRKARRNRGDRPAGLSERETEVLRLLADGKTNQQIADDLFISLNTVSYHLRHIFAKTGAGNRTEAASFAHHHGLASDSTPDPRNAATKPQV
jgi:DNA-binding CsgD family transcriptional regulator/pimeloyl-ACP methyl ester carboxylesterase